MKWCFCFLWQLAAIVVASGAEFVPPPEQDRNQTVAFLESNMAVHVLANEVVIDLMSVTLERN